MAMLFSKYTWSLMMSFQNSKIWVCLEKFTNTHIPYGDNKKLPDLIHDHVDQDVHLDPQDGLESPQNP